MFSQFDGGPFPCKGRTCLWLISSHSWVHTVSLTTVPCPELDTILFGKRKPFRSSWNVPDTVPRSLHELSDFPPRLCVTFGECDIEISTSRLSGVKWLTRCHTRSSSWQNQGLNLCLLLSESMVFVIACVTLIRRAQQKALAVDWLELSRLYWRLSKLKWLALQY